MLRTCTLVMSAILPVSAGTLTSTQLCWQANDPFPAYQFTNCSFTSGSDSQNIATPNPDSTPDNPLPDQVFQGTAIAITAPDTWHVPLDASITAYRKDMYVFQVDDDGNNLPHPTAAVATAQSDDSHNDIRRGWESTLSTTFFRSTDRLRVPAGSVSPFSCRNRPWVMGLPVLTSNTRLALLPSLFPASPLTTRSLQGW